MTETINPQSTEEWLALRTEDITSTESAALFGISPYVTLFELWFRKKEGTVTEMEPTERMKWGTRLQDAIATGIAEDFGIKNIRPMKEYMRRKEWRLGSSFDYAVGSDGILEVKNVGFDAYQRGWLIDDAGKVVEAPVWIECQLQHQLLVSGRTRGYIGAVIGGNQGVLIERQVDETVATSIRERATNFWQSIRENKPPKPDFEKDARFISKLFGYAKAGKTVDFSGEGLLTVQAQSYKEISETIKHLEGTKEGLKAKFLMRLGDAEKAKGDGYTISAGMVGAKKIEYERKGYRNFRINWKKGDK